MKKVIPLAILAMIIVPVYVVAARSDSLSGAKPSIVLVHGAWADGSSWSGVVGRLQDQGYTVYVPPNPLRGLASDSAYLASFLQTITGPINFVPIAGDVDLYIKPSIFPSCFANDLKADKAAVLASEQRPLVLSVLGDKSGVPAWKTIPSWYLIGTLDLVIPPFAQLFMAQRAHATIAYVNAAHPSMISHPRGAADLIIQAAQSLQDNSDRNSEQALTPNSL